MCARIEGGDRPEVFSRQRSTASATPDEHLRQPPPQGAARSEPTPAGRMRERSVSPGRRSPPTRPHGGELLAGGLGQVRIVVRTEDDEVAVDVEDPEPVRVARTFEEPAAAGRVDVPEHPVPPALCGVGLSRHLEFEVEPLVAVDGDRAGRGHPGPPLRLERRCCPPGRWRPRRCWQCRGRGRPCGESSSLVHPSVASRHRPCHRTCRSPPTRSLPRRSRPPRSEMRAPAPPHVWRARQPDRR